MKLLDIFLTVAAIVGSAYVLYRCWWKNRDKCPGASPGSSKPRKTILPRNPDESVGRPLGDGAPHRRRREPHGKL